MSSGDKQGAEWFTVEQLAKEVELQAGRHPLADVHLTSQSYVALCKLAASALSSCTRTMPPELSGMIRDMDDALLAQRQLRGTVNEVRSQWERVKVYLEGAYAPVPESEATVPERDWRVTLRTARNTALKAWEQSGQGALDRVAWVVSEMDAILDGRPSPRSVPADQSSASSATTDIAALAECLKKLENEADGSWTPAAVQALAMAKSCFEGLAPRSSTPAPSAITPRFACQASDCSTEPGKARDCKWGWECQAWKDARSAPRSSTTRIMGYDLGRPGGDQTVATCRVVDRIEECATPNQCLLAGKCQRFATTTPKGSAT